MASSTITTRPTTFSFHHFSPSFPKQKTHLKPFTNPHNFPPFQNPENRLKTTTKSTDISKEDKPISDNSNSDDPTSSDSSMNDQNFDRIRLEEKFAVLNTGIYECRSCGYKYDESVGDPTYPIPACLPFGQLPEDWRCPTCGAAKSFFESKSVEIAGFAQNQQFGLGGNSLTSGQKALLIYGSLFFFFMLFLSGYFLQ